MASQSFNARGGISVGLTGTSVISETGFGTFPVGISASGGITFNRDITINGVFAGIGNTGTENTRFGKNSIISPLISATDNTAVGAEALRQVTSGKYNNAFGSRALYNVTTGQDNQGIGYFSLFSAISSQNNVGVGSYTLYSSTANDNTAIGSGAVNNITTSTGVVAIGRNAGALKADGTGLTSGGTDSVYIGNAARAFSNSDNRSIVIGAGAVGLGANTAVIGATTQTSATIYGTLNAPGGISASGGATFAGTISLNGQTFTNVVSSVNGLTGIIGTLIAPIAVTGGNYTVFTFPNGVTATGSKRPYYQSPYYGGRATSTAAMVANRTYFMLHNTPRGVSLTTLRLSTASTGTTGNVYFSVWSVNTSSGVPDQRLYASASIAIPGSFNFASVTNSNGLVRVPAGSFYIAASFSSTPTLYVHSSDRNIHVFGSQDYTSGYNFYLPAMDTNGFTAPSSITQSGTTFGFIDYYPTQLTIPILEWQGT